MTSNENNRFKVFLGRYDKGIKPNEMLESARKHCRDVFGKMVNPEGCMVAVSRWDSGFEKSAYSNDSQSVFKGMADSWINGNGVIAAIYNFEPDNSTIRYRPDEIFVLDCPALGVFLPKEGVICKDSDGDTLSRDLRRIIGEKSSDASASTDEAASDATAVATEAVASAAEEAAEAAAAATSAAMDAAGYGTFHIIADANRRSRATAASSFAGKVSRGTVLQGMIMIGEDGESNWLRLADGSGFVSAVNISQTAPPQLATILGERRFRPSEDLKLYASPSEQSPVVDTVPAGTLLVLTGITQSGFAEAKGRTGGVGYFRAAGYDFSR